MESLKNEICQVKSFSFESVAQGQNGWSGKGQGQIESVIEDDNLIFTEKGTWLNSKKQQFQFLNVYKWCFKPSLISLFHLRYGANQPVHIVDLQQANESRWVSISPHQCHDDLYTVELLHLQNRIALNWKVEGKDKRVEMKYEYKK